MRHFPPSLLCSGSPAAPAARSDARPGGSSAGEPDTPPVDAPEATWGRTRFRVIRYADDPILGEWTNVGIVAWEDQRVEVRWLSLDAYGRLVAYWPKVPTYGFLGDRMLGYGAQPSDVLARWESHPMSCIVLGELGASIRPLEELLEWLVQRFLWPFAESPAYRPPVDATSGHKE